MDVDKLMSSGQTLVAPEAVNNRARTEPPVENKIVEKQRERNNSEVKKEKPDVTIRSGRLKSGMPSVRIRNSSLKMPEIKNDSKMKVEFDHEAEQFRMVKKTIEHANQKMFGVSSMFQYSIHEKTNQIMIKVIDKETKEVIMEIPPEKALDAIAKMWELAGIFVDEKR